MLRSGRTLGYARYGLQGGIPLFYFTGGNSSRLEGLWFDQAARERRIQLIVPGSRGQRSSAAGNACVDPRNVAAG